MSRYLRDRDAILEAAADGGAAVMNLTTLTVVMNDQRQYITELYRELYDDYDDPVALVRAVNERLEGRLLHGANVVPAGNPDGTLRMTEHDRYLALERAKKMGSKGIPWWKFREYEGFLHYLLEQDRHAAKLRMRRYRQRLKEKRDGKARGQSSGQADSEGTAS